MLDEVKVWALSVGFIENTEEHSINDMVLEKPIGDATLDVWIRYPEREDELIMIDYAQGYEETVRLAEVSTATQVREICELFEDALMRIKTVAEDKSRA